MFYGNFGRMQVEVSKHTEGFKDKMTRPNGLPESLIRYDGIHLKILLFPKFWLIYYRWCLDEK